MNVTAPRAKLCALVEKCAAACDTAKGSPTQYTNVVLRARGTSLRVDGEGYDAFITGAVDEVVVDQPGEVSLPVKMLLERLAVLAEGPVQLTTAQTSGNLRLQAVGAPRFFSVPAFSGEQVRPRALPTEGAATVKAAELLSVLDATHACVSKDTTRSHVNSMLVKLSARDGRADQLRTVGTDGHRIAVVDRTLEAPMPAPFELLLSLKSVGVLRTALRRTKGTAVSVWTSPRSLGLEIEGVRYEFKLVDAQFPPYEGVIPSGDCLTVRANRANIAGVVESLLVAADVDKGLGLRLVYETKKAARRGAQLRFKVVDPGGGWATDEATVEVEGAGEIDPWYLNPRYVKEALAAATEAAPDEGEILVDLRPGLTATVIRSRGKVMEALYVVMPMRGDVVA